MAPEIDQKKFSGNNLIDTIIITLETLSACFAFQIVFLEN